MFFFSCLPIFCAEAHSASAAMKSTAVFIATARVDTEIATRYRSREDGRREREIFRGHYEGVPCAVRFYVW